MKIGRKEKLNEKRKAVARKRWLLAKSPNDLAPLYSASRATIAQLR